MPKTKRTKTGYTTDADALAALHEQVPHPFLTSLLRHRDVTKLRTTVDGLIKSTGDDGRIHTTYQQTIAITGRLSSTEPNLQNIPVRTDEGRRIRGRLHRRAGLRERDDRRLLADRDADHGAPVRGRRADRGLQLRRGPAHLRRRRRRSAIPIEQVHGEMRRRIKAMTYGLVYGLSAFGLSHQLKISREEAQAQMDLYFDRFGGVRDYLRRIVDTARIEGYTETLLGRRRYIPDLTSDNRQRRELAERNALNAPIQGSAADLIKVAMLKVDARIKAEGLRVPAAAPGARRTGRRGGAGGAGADRRRAARGDGQRLPVSTFRWTCRSASAPAGRRRRTSCIVGRRLTSVVVGRRWSPASEPSGQNRRTPCHNRSHCRPPGPPTPLVGQRLADTDEGGPCETRRRARAGDRIGSRVPEGYARDTDPASRRPVSDPSGRRPGH